MIKNAIIAILCLLTGYFWTDVANAEFLGSDVGVWVGAETITDGGDAVQLGITLEWKYVEVDISHGIRRTDWRTIGEPEWQMDEWQSGTIGTFRIYPTNLRPIRPLLTWSHSSDITRGAPFNEENEPTSDFFGVGVTIETKRFELDVAYGSLGRECRVIQCSPGSRTNELRLSFRGYIFK